MSSINGLGNSNPVGNIANSPVRKQASADAPRQGVTDKLELSGMSHLLKALKTNDIRADKVAQVKSLIESGQYETDQKLDVAADRLLDDLSK